MNLTRFEQFWLAEHQRLRDATDPKLQQQQFKFSEVTANTTQAQILQRAARLSERQGVLTQLHHWQQLRRLLTLVFAALAVLAGIGSSQAILSQPQPISLLFALSLLLLPNLLLFVFWLVFALRRPRPSGVTGVAYALLTLLQRKRGEGALEHSWLNHVQQQRLLQPLMALTTHGFWLLLSSAAWLTLLIYLSFNDYSFQWATTILASHQVQSIAQAINSLPHVLFAAELPLVTNSAAALTDANAAGRWLTLCLMTYGILPRALAALGALLLFFWRSQHMRLELQAEGYAAVVQGIARVQQRATTVDADNGDASEQLRFQYASHGSGHYTVSIDYEAAADFTASDDYLGVVATYADKQALVARFKDTPSAQLQVRVATRLTPDRSSLRYLAELAATTQQLTVILVRGQQATYLTPWQQQLEQYGVDYVVA
ncbi:DUF2868 domain-containing protein [Pseudidiomarina sp.]|uniref:DUF2868 domain-containing protein n=1 Tax=Pseudidiomarina sp. TaxID=2081707 RepID=UPI003A97C77B